MRLHRFYTPIDFKQEVIFKDKEYVHQWKNVFRYKSGAEVILFDGKGNECIYEIITLEKTEARLKHISQKNSLMQEKNITLALSLIKKDNFELVLQKCTEIGVIKFIPIITEHSEKKLFNVERGRKILIEATEQSGWGKVPELLEQKTLEGFLKENKNKIIAFDMEGGSLSQIPNESITYAIGPEGGFSDRDVESLTKAGALWYTLGASTLRAETAAIIAGARLCQ